MFLTHWVTKYIGIPFIDHGTTNKGCDCWGLVRLVYRQEKKIELGQYDYLNAVDCDEIQEIVRKNKVFEFKEIVTPHEFDLVLLRMHGRPCHIGIWVEPNRILHASYNIGVVLEDKSGSRLKGRVEGYYTYG